MNHAGRFERLRESIAKADVDALLVTNLTNVRYLTGFSGTNGQVLVSATTALFFTDPRYEARAADLVRGAEVVIYDERLSDLLPDALIRNDVKRLGLEGSSVTLAERDRLAAHLGDIELLPVADVVEDLRRVKEPEEIDLIRQACAVTDDAFTWILDRLVPGAMEREIALDLEVRMRLSGADEVSFPPIVGSGPLSAHIHHSPSDRPLAKGELVLLDFGARVNGYCSDLTRTVALGTPGDEEMAIYLTVLEAQRAALSEIRPAAETAYVDHVARRVIDEAGHGDHFGHGLGHGVGLDIHEAPTLKKVSGETLDAGNVVTVEPGVYLPGRGGVRIEDCVQVTPDGISVLTQAPKEELIQL
jgi:Xaa-Pro aminopeptidase